MGFSIEYADKEAAFHVSIRNLEAVDNGIVCRTGQDRLDGRSFYELQLLVFDFVFCADAYRRDRRKDLLLQENDYVVLRFLAEDVGRNLDSVLDAILRTLANRRSRSSRM